MAYIDKAEYEVRVATDILDQITGGDDTILDDAESDTMQLITDRLSSKFKITEEFALTGADRNRTVVRWIIVISLYYVYGRVADEDIPARVVKDYDDALRDLDKVASGKMGLSIARQTDETGATKGSFYISSETPRDHDMF